MAIIGSLIALPHKGLGVRRSTALGYSFFCRCEGLDHNERAPPSTALALFSWHLESIASFAFGPWARNMGFRVSRRRSFADDVTGLCPL